MTVDFHALPADPAFAAAVADLDSAAAAFDSGVPVALLPVRLETRFAQVRVPGPSGVPVTLIAALAAVLADIHSIAERPYATKLTGSVRDRKAQKGALETPLYAAVEDECAAAVRHADDLRAVLAMPLTRVTAAQEKEIVAQVQGVRLALPAARVALGALRSPFQRDRLVTLLDDAWTAVEPSLGRIEKRVLPTVAFSRDLGIAAAAQSARTLGRTPLGRPLRATGMPGSPTGLGARVVIADGTTPQALGAVRAIPMDYSRISDSASAAEAIGRGAATMTPQDLLVAAAAIVVLPGRLKADLLALVDAVARTRTGLDRVREILAAVPSDRPDLDLTVPPHLREVVFELPPQEHVEDRLLLRIYPEVLAVDTHEPDLTAGEVAAGNAFWTATKAAGADQALQLGAWRALCWGRSTGRAAWIAKATTPHDPGPTAGALVGRSILDDVEILAKRLDEVARARATVTAVTLRPSRRLAAAVSKAVTAVRTDLSGSPDLPAAFLSSLADRVGTILRTIDSLIAGKVVGAKTWHRQMQIARHALARISFEPEPVPDLVARAVKASTWSRAARSGVLPDRFAVVTVTSGVVTHVAAGSPVPADLKLSLDPDPANQSTEQFSLDQDGNLVVAPSIRWMVDFDEAVTKGMAISLPITPAEALAGFDEVLVVGLAAGAPDHGAERLAAMIDAHHYTASGVELLGVGTPTNNSEAAAAGHSSTDDADDAFPVERGDSLVRAGRDTEGARLALALGIDPGRLAHVRGSGGLGTTEALVVNRALYPGTLGHALEELVGALMPAVERDRLQEFVVGNVTGRGLLPAFRMGDEPYGVLATTAFSQFRPDASDTLPLAAAAAERDAQAHFDAVLWAFLDQMNEDWTRARLRHVKHAHSPETRRPDFDAQAHFLDMLGLQATSAQSAYRFAVNVANRGGIRGHPDLSLGFGIPPAAGPAAGDPSAFGPFAAMERFAAPLRLAFGLSADAPRDGAGVAGAWADVFERLVDSRAFGLRLMRGAKPLRGVVADGGTAEAVAGLLADTASTMSALSVQVDSAGRPLAEILLRQALLAELRRAAVRILAIEGLAGDALFALAGSSAHYASSTLAGVRPDISAWSLLFDSFDDVSRRFYFNFGGNPFFTYLGARSLETYLANRGDNGMVQGYPGKAGQQAVFDALAGHANAVQRAGNLPAARLDALVREHLDVCSHRLDAWITGLAHRRMASLRKTRPLGAHIGAYGWIENLRPYPGRVVAAQVPPALAGRPGRPVTVDLDRPDQGFIQTPSPTHAVTASILRGAFESQSNETALGNEMSVNLSSNRVRVAQSLIDGVRAGNDLGALLGYRFERFLHEYSARTATPGAELGALIGPLRRAFPTVATVDANADAAASRQRQVVDGLALVRTVLDWIHLQPARAGDPRTVREILAEGTFGGYPWGLPAAELPSAPPVAQRDGLARGIDALADAVDALGDLTLSEAVHQIARGNHARASAVLAALAEGKAPPTPEITQTPRTGLAVSHRVLLQLSPVGPDVPVPGWDTVPPTPRSLLDPTLNAWLAGLLPEPALIRVRVGTVPSTDDAPLAEVSVADLGLQPLDLLALLGPGFEAGLGDLTARVLDHRRPVNIEPDQPLPTPASTPRDRYTVVPERAPQWSPDVHSIADASSLLEAVHDLLSRGRAATPADYRLGGGGTGAVDEPDLATRVARLRGTAVDAALALARLLADDPSLDVAILADDPQAFVAAHADVHVSNDPQAGRVLAHPDAMWGVREQWRRSVIAAAQFGVKASPPRRYARRAQVCLELLEAAQTGYIELVGRLQTAGTGAGSQALLGTARALLGEGVALLPRFTLGDARPDLVEALGVDLVPPDDVDAWLEGAASVRDPARCLSDVLVLAEAIGSTTPSASVAQLPSASSEPWVGGAIEDPEAQTGRLSIVVYGAGALPSVADESAVALFVDGWDEVVPFRQETTGVAVHYGQPDATAPQCVLLAVPPVRGQAWSLGTLVATLHDTLELARNRTVELEHVSDDLYGQVLPLVVGELVPEALHSGTSPAGSRVILDFATNNPRGA
jgi:hypothetical protein